LVIASAVVAADCPTFTNGNSYSDAVPCQNATCASWGVVLPSFGPPICTDPDDLDINYVTISVTATAWANCTKSSSKTSCTESPESCADYWLYSDRACTVQCTTASFLPTYCKAPAP
jgi:hypothetical protein